MSAGMDCAYCPDVIAPGANYATAPVAHLWCAFRERQRLEAEAAANHEPGCLCQDPCCPAARTPLSDFTRKLRRAASSTGLAGCVLWNRDPGGTWGGTPEIAHCELAASPSLAFWDLPGRTPAWLVVAQTPCATEDLEQPVQEPRPLEAHRRYKCRLGHVHQDAGTGTTRKEAS